MLLRMSFDQLDLVEAESLDAALHGAMETPDLVLLDILLKGLSGIEGIDLLRRKWPGAKVIMVSSDTSGETIRRALSRGAFAYVSKEESAENILAIVHLALDRSRTRAPDPAIKPESAGAALRLTPRQREVLDLLCQGLSNKAIGRKLALTENTVRWHVQAILALLEVSNRSEAAFAARHRGLIN